MSSPPDSSPLVGTVIAGKYRVESFLGSGGMGSVVAARHVQLGQKLALKLLNPGALADQESLARFFREAQATASLDCEQVVKVFDIGQTEDGAPFIVMERLIGKDLADLLAAWGPFSIGLAVECLLQAAIGMGEAHAAGIIHRDLKPSNLFLTRRKSGSPLLKILDFGISKVSSRDQVSLTQTRTVVGSPLYMSPEQVRDPRRVDERADVWSLGAILHELLTGSPAFDGETLPSVCASIVSDDPRPIWREDAPPELVQLVRDCLEKHPDRRVQTMAELEERLRGISESLPQTLLPSIEEDPSSRPLGFPASTGNSESRMMFVQPTLSDSSNMRARLDSEAGLRRTPGGSPANAPTLAAATLPPPSRRGKVIGFAGVAVTALILGLMTTGIMHYETPPAPSVLTPAGNSPASPAPPATFQYFLDSTPPGALVFEGEKMVGRTPTALPNVAPGEQKDIELRLEGYVPYVVHHNHLTADRHGVIELLPAPRPEETKEKSPTAARSAPAAAPAKRPSAAPAPSSDIHLSR